MFYEYKVDLIFESSSNVYQRSFPCVRSMQKWKKSYESAEMPVIISVPKYFVGMTPKNIGNSIFLNNQEKNWNNEISLNWR